MYASDFDNFKHPSRKPWLVVVVLALVGLTGWLVYWSFESDKLGKEEEPAVPVINRLGSIVKKQDSVVKPGVVTAGQKADKPSTNSVPISVRRTGIEGVASALAKSKALESAGEYVKARRAYLDLLKTAKDAQTVADIERRLGIVNSKLVTAPIPMPEKTEYVVKSGDSVEKIAKAYGTTVEAVKNSNQIANPALIRKGDKLQILTGKFAVQVSKGGNTLALFLNGEFFKRYSVGTGKFGKTPVGTFVINNKIPEPPWTKGSKIIPFGDKENILGTRWMSIKATGDTPDVAGYGIHGTWDDVSIGKAESLGCIRMHNSDVEELFSLLPVGTPVVIVE
jgi:lipoprotein-anchoring transpeptidase ErfK/SrfK